jgi:hypothetical protein
MGRPARTYNRNILGGNTARLPVSSLSPFPPTVLAYAGCQVDG